MLQSRMNELIEDASQYSLPSRRSFAQEDLFQLTTFVEPRSDADEACTFPAHETRKMG